MRLLAVERKDDKLIYELEFTEEEMSQSIDIDSYAKEDTDDVITVTFQDLSWIECVDIHAIIGGKGNCISYECNEDMFGLQTRNRDKIVPTWTKNKTKIKGEK